MAKLSKGANIRNRYKQVPHPIQDTNGKVTNSQIDTTKEGQEVSPFLRETQLNQKLNTYLRKWKKNFIIQSFLLNHNLIKWMSAITPERYNDFGKISYIN